MNSHCAGHLTGCGGADLHNSLTSASSASSEHFPHKTEKMPNISDKAAAFHSHKHTVPVKLKRLTILKQFFS